MAFPSDLDPTLDVTDVDAITSDLIAELDLRILALEAKVGADGSQVTTSLDYRVAHAGGGSVSPTTTEGDMIVRGASTDERLPIGNEGEVLRVLSGVVAWGAPPWISSPAATNGQVLRRVAGAWSAVTLLPGDIGAIAAPSASTGQFLKYDGSGWVSAGIGFGDVADLGTAAQYDVGLYLSTSGSDLTVNTALIATRAYVDATVGGLLYKHACRAVATTNVASLSGAATIDGVSLIAGDRVLLVGQSDAKQNGAWIVAAGVWSRPSPAELQASAAFPVSEGTTYADSIWYVTTNDPIIEGVTSVAIARASFSPADGSITLAKLGSDVTVGKLTASELTACAYAATDSSVDVVVGGFRFDPADYAISGKTTVLTVTLWGRVVSGLAGTVTVYDVTSGTPSSVGTASITSTTGALSTVSISLPVSAKTYQLAIKVSGGSTAADIVEVTGAVRRITWS